MQWLTDQPSAAGVPVVPGSPADSLVFTSYSENFGQIAPCLIVFAGQGCGAIMPRVPHTSIWLHEAWPMEAAPEEITQLLFNWRHGDKAALEQLTPLVYEELRRLARGFMGKERRDHTLQTSALINEAYLRLVDQDETNWQNRAHFFAVAAQIMRHILIDHARSYGYEKRGAGAQRIGLDEVMVFSEERAGELVALDEALTSLATVDPRKSRIIELRFFGGLNIDETAEVMELSPTTVQRESRAAKAWLWRFIKGENPAENL